MTVSRRTFIETAGATALLSTTTLTSSLAQSSGGFNGHKTQINLDFMGGGDWPFLNVMKNATPWAGRSAPISDISVFDSNGYVTDITQGGYGGIVCFMSIPKWKERPGDYFIMGDGYGQIGVTGLGVNTWYPKADKWKFRFTPDHVNNDGDIHVYIAATKAPNYFRNIRICHVDDYDLLELQGKIFQTKFIELCKTFGVIRFLNWNDMNFTNASNFSDFTPISYAQWRGHLDPKLYVGTIKRDGSNITKYTCGAPPAGFELTDKCHVYGNFDTAQLASAKITAISYGASTVLTLDAVPPGWTTGHKLFFNAYGNAAPAQMFYQTFMIIDINGANVTINLNSTGFKPVYSYPNTVWFCGVVQTLNVNNTGDIPIAGPWAQPSISGPFGGWGAPAWNNSTTYAKNYVVCDSTNVPGQVFKCLIANSNNRPSSSQLNWAAGPYNGVSILTYDAGMNAWACISDTSVAQLNTQMQLAPIEVMVALCNEVGAHPWFVIPFMACDGAPNTPTTSDLPDFVSKLADYVKKHLNPGLIPRYEAANEVWNGMFWATRYAWARTFMRQKSYNGTLSMFDCNNWYGLASSLVAQAIANVYGISQKDVRTQMMYQMVSGGWAVFGLHPVSDPGYLSRFESPLFLSQGGNSPAKNWHTHLAIATYWGVGYWGSEYEVELAGLWDVATDPAIKQEVLDTYAASANIAPWDGSVAYRKNDIVYEGIASSNSVGAAYICTTENANRFPSASPSYWTTKNKYGSGDRPPAYGTLPCFKVIYKNFAGLAAKYSLKMTQYEGGYEPLNNEGDANSIINRFRIASRLSPQIATASLQTMNDFIVAGVSAGITAEFPSKFQLSNGSARIDPWGLYIPDIYAAPSAEWQAVLSFG
jgi:hypothetical protein